MRHTLAAGMAGALAVLLAVGSGGGAQEPVPPEGGSTDEREVVLEGVIISSNPSSSMALVRISGARRGRSVRVGEQVYGMKLVEVSEDQAVFEREGVRQRLLLTGGSAPPPQTVAEVPESSPDGGMHTILPADPQDPTEEWIRRRIDRSAADSRIERELPLILKETALVPQVEEGEVQGLQIAHLPEGTILSEAGLLPGDVLLSINGSPLNGLASLSGLYPRLQSEDEIRVVLERSGRIVKLAYEFQ